MNESLNLKEANLNDVLKLFQFHHDGESAMIRLTFSWAKFYMKRLKSESFYVEDAKIYECEYTIDNLYSIVCKMNEIDSNGNMTTDELPKSFDEHIVLVKFDKDLAIIDGRRRINHFFRTKEKEYAKVYLMDVSEIFV